MPYEPPHRRRSPGWLRATDSNQVHAIAIRLQHLMTLQDVSDRQDWLFDACVSELEYRHRAERVWWKRCSCALCIPPFPDA